MRIKPKQLILAGLFTALMIVGAYVKIPMPVVMSFTLQVFFCLLCGICLPPFPAFLSMLTYVFIGVLGLPVFTFGGGITSFFQPSFGFLLAFLLMAPLSGILARAFEKKMKSWMAMALSCTINVLIMHLIGAVYGYFVMNYYVGSAMSFGAVIASFCLIFIPFDLVKAALAVVIADRLRKFKVI